MTARKEAADVARAASALLRAKDSTAALELLLPAAERHPDSADIAIQLGRALQSEGRIGEAQAAWTRALALAPDDPRALVGAAICADSRDAHDEAIALLRRASRLAPEREDVAIRLLRSLAKSGRRRSVETTARRVRERFPASLAVALASARALQSVGAHAAAATAWRAVLAVAPEIREAQKHVAVADVAAAARAASGDRTAATRRADAMLALTHDFVRGVVDLEFPVLQDAVDVIRRDSGAQGLDALWRDSRPRGASVQRAARAGQVARAIVQAWHAEAGVSRTAPSGLPLLLPSAAARFQRDVAASLEGWRASALYRDLRRVEAERRSLRSRPPTRGRRRRHVVIASLNWNFTRPLVDALADEPWCRTVPLDLRQHRASVKDLPASSFFPPRTATVEPAWWQGATDTLREALGEADLVVVDWCNTAAIELSRTLPPTTRLVIRVHSYEAFSYLPYLVNWGGVDGLIFVSEPIRRFFTEQHGERTAGIPTIVAGNAMPRPPAAPSTRHGRARRTLGILKYADSNKDPIFALRILRELRQDDDRWCLRLAGEDWPPDEVLPPYERAYKRRYLRLLREWGLEDHVHVDGFQPDPHAWFQRIGFVLSCSQREGTHEALLDGIQAGCLPVIRDWPMLSRYGGPGAVYPALADSVVSTPHEAASLAARLGSGRRPPPVSAPDLMPGLDAALEFLSSVAR